MSVGTFERLINIFKKAFMNFKFELDDELMVEIWYNELVYMDDDKAILAAKKVISTCDFVTIKNIKAAYGEINSPLQIENEEGWGLVERAIRCYGYMRAEEAMTSLPSQVQRAVCFMGGFQSICEAGNKDVIRGQFNKAMSAVNQRLKVNSTLGQPLLQQITQYQLLAENKENERLQLQTSKHLHIEQKQEYKSDEERLNQNQKNIDSIKNIIRQSLQAKEVRGA